MKLANISDTLKYIALLLPVSIKSATQNKKMFYILSTFMLLQNLIFFSIWLIYFDQFSNLRGWQLTDMAKLYGISAAGFGLAFFVCGGTMDIGRAISEGELDVHLGRPKHPLLSLQFKNCRAQGLGDIMTAPVLWVVVAQCHIIEILTLSLLSCFSALVILAFALIANSLAFFSSESSRFSDQLLESFVIMSSYPQKGYNFAIKVVLFTALPAGFVAYLPVIIVQDASLLKVLGFVMFAIFYYVLAIKFFNYGLKRYTSGNQFIKTL